MCLLASEEENSVARPVFVMARGLSFADGDSRAEFMIEDAGNVVLAKKLNANTQKFYNLTIRVTDGVHNVYTQVMCARASHE